MSYKILIGTTETLGDLLSGAIELGPFGEAPLGGLTLIFSAPVGTVIFPGAAGAFLSCKAIVAAIEAVGALAGMAKYRSYDGGPQTTSRAGDGKLIAQGRVILQKDAGFTMSNLGTANVLLGVDTVAPTVNAGLIPGAKILGFTSGAVPGQLAALIAP